jgi:hypothetical protein
MQQKLCIPMQFMLDFKNRVLKTMSKFTNRPVVRLQGKWKLTEKEKNTPS